MENLFPSILKAADLFIYLFFSSKVSTDPGQDDMEPVQVPAFITPWASPSFMHPPTPFGKNQ